VVSLVQNSSTCPYEICLDTFLFPWAQLVEITGAAVSRNPDTQAVTQATLKRLGLEAAWVGGSLSSTLHEAVTHVVVFTTPETPVFLHLLLSSIQVQEQREKLEQSGVNIVSHVWLQDCLQQHCILSVATYSLRYRHIL
jgi:hypothetical protein